MSNIAGKAYAMSLLTPIKSYMTLANELIFWLVGTRLFRSNLNGLLTLSMIHYARWVILRPGDFPRLASTQPKERLQYSYMLFFSNFNGSWAQYVDSFSAAIPSGLDLLWWRNVGWPRSVPEQPFHRYVNQNQLWTNHYYNAYPMAAANDIKAAEHVRTELLSFVQETREESAAAFVERYHRLLKTLQHDISEMAPTPIVSLASQAVIERCRKDSVAPVADRASETIKVA